MYKKIVLLFTFFCLIITAGKAQYKASWKSLDKKPVPEWYKDAKFGIFIHWGVYSVPAFSKVGGYAEWYQHKLRSDSTSPTAKYQKKVYGNQSYYDLAKYFKAQLFDPDAWAALFEKSGAKYVALTSKHHDGYCLWPSKVGDRDWGFPWNATEVGPHRDLIKELFTALRKTDVKPGLYYSLYEWYNPLYLRNVDSFVLRHTIPQMKDLINHYHPYVLFTDGGWDQTAKTWRATQFLSWLYDDSPMKDSIVTYDRWGSGVRFHHGMVYTPEYQPGMTFHGHYFEESQGMGYSYGYNRAEDISDYSSGRLLTLQLIDIVSRGGNFLLDIGPRADGKIPAVMQERLLHIGKWLQVNGAAIYGTRPWKKAVQWTAGKRDYKPKKGETLLLKQTIHPSPGYASKEIFFTHKQDTLFCILPKYPDGKLVIKGMQLPTNAEVSLLATGKKLRWENEASDVAVSMPPFDPYKIKPSDAYVIQIVHAPDFVSQPTIKADYTKFGTRPVISMASATPEVSIYYTEDGSRPDKHAKLYTKPFEVKSATRMKAMAYKKGWVSSRVDSLQADVYQWHQAIKGLSPKAGLMYRYYQADTPSLDMKAPLIEKGIISTFSLDKKKRKSKFTFDYRGYIKIVKSGIYTFYTTSDDGSDLWIDGEKVVDNGGAHGAVTKSGKAALKKGWHKIRVRYFDGGGGNELKVEMKPAGGTKQEIPADLLFH